MPGTSDTSRIVMAYSQCRGDRAREVAARGMGELRPAGRGPSRVLLFVPLFLVLCWSCREAPARASREVDAEMLHTAMEQLTEVIVHDIFSPPQASRTYAYASIAAYEVLAMGRPGYRTLGGQLNGLNPPPRGADGISYSYPAAALQAFLVVGKALTFSPEHVDSLILATRGRLRSQGIPTGVLERSIALGDRVARHILEWASRDHYLETRGYPQFPVTAEAGRWTPTPPMYMDAVEPHWSRLRPFVMDSSSQFQPRPPHAYDMSKGSTFYGQVKEVFDAGNHLTEEERAIAAFWDCNPYVMHVRGHAMVATKKITPGGHWMGISAIAARTSGAGLVESAEAYARTAIAVADGFISAWDEKYRSVVIRPETAIQEHLDREWKPLLQTPPFPEYTSAHSVISMAAATVLTNQFGEGFGFVDSTEVPFGLPPRTFSSFDQAAGEAAISRLFGGIHYRMAIEEGKAQGGKVGELVVERLRTRSRAIAQD